MPKVYISYFYNLRFFPNNALPLSTAISDPAWFHDFKGPDYKFVDKRGVINGMRYNKLVFDKEFQYNLKMSNRACSKDCWQKKDGTCKFLTMYRKQLNLYFPGGPIDLLQELDQLCDEFISWEFDEPIVILLVHEAPSNPCSERVALKKWFKDYGYELEEWRKDINV